jgi:hypothetical protein
MAGARRAYTWRAYTWPVSQLWDPLHFIMQTRQFHNLRARVGAQVCMGRGSSECP